VARAVREGPGDGPLDQPDVPAFRTEPRPGLTPAI
jgi:hypothetical protein